MLGFLFKSVVRTFFHARRTRARSLHRGIGQRGSTNLTFLSMHEGRDVCSRAPNLSDVRKRAIQDSRRFDDMADVASIWDVGQIKNVAPLASDFNSDNDPASVGIEPNTLDQDGFVHRFAQYMIGSLRHRSSSLVFGQDRAMRFRCLFSSLAAVELILQSPSTKPLS